MKKPGSKPKKNTLMEREGENISPPEPSAAPPADSDDAGSPQDEPDYESLLSRSRDMLDGKYDTTPEGRREAKALALELELMNPPDSKPPKGHFGRVVDLVRRLRAHQQRRSATAINESRPSAPAVGANSLTPPSPPAPAVPNEPRLPSAPASASPAPANLPPRLASPATRPSPRAPQSEIVPPSPHPAGDSPGESGYPSSPPLKGYPQDSFFAGNKVAPSPLSADERGTSPNPRLRQGVSSAAPAPDPLNRTGHTTDWYAPASWSKTGKLDPFPSRAQKSARKLRSISNYRFRHLQHLNSRGF